MAPKPAEPLPVHVPLAAEVPAHLVQHVMSDGKLTVLDSATGGLSSFRLAVTDDELTLVIVSDP